MAGWFQSSTSHCRRAQPRFTAAAASANLGKHEQVFKMQARALPGGIDRKIQREARRHAVFFGDEAFVVGMGTEAVAQQLLFSDLDRVRLSLELGERVDEGVHERNIG